MKSVISKKYCMLSFYNCTEKKENPNNISTIEQLTPKKLYKRFAY